MKFNAEKLKSIAQPMSDEERAKMNYRIENADWLRMSATIALKIRKILRSQNISQVEFASRMGVTPAQISKLLSGKVNFELKTISKLQTILGEPIIDIDLSIKPKNEIELKISTQVVFVYVKSDPIYTRTNVNDDTCFRTYKILG